MKPQNRDRFALLRRFVIFVLLINLLILVSRLWPAWTRAYMEGNRLSDSNCPPRHILEKRKERLAWVTSAYGNDIGYHRQILALIMSLRAHGAEEDIFVIDDGSLKVDFKTQVERVGAKVLPVEPVSVPEKVARTLDEKRHLPNFIRLRLWNMTGFDRLIFIDGDMLAVKDISPIRQLPCPSAAPQKAGTMNAGLFVLCPCEHTAKVMMEKLQRADCRYPQAEQTFVSRFFRGKWHFVSTCLNARCYDWHPWLKQFLHWHFYFWPSRDMCRMEDVVLLHFSSDKKPWSRNAEKYYTKEVLDLYEKGLQLIAGI